MIKDLDNTIKKICENELPADIASPSIINISFARPDESSILSSLQTDSTGVINFFLYDVEENLEYRTSNWMVKQGETQGTGTFKKHPPKRINCSYLVTVWTRADDPLIEHYILGEIIEILMRNETLPANALQGRLAGMKPLPFSTCLHPSRLNTGEFWQAMGGKPRPAVNYTVMMDVDVHALVTAPMVDAAKKVTDTRQKV